MVKRIIYTFVMHFVKYGKMGNKPQKSNNGTILAVALIGIGLIWLFQKSLTNITMPDLYWYNFHFPFLTGFHNFRHFIFSWPVIFILVGLVLMAGRRKSGIVLIIIGGIFLVSKISHGGFITFTLVIPILLITIGVILIAKYLTDKG